MSKIRIVANWKSNKSPDEALQWLREFTNQTTKINIQQPIEVIICPPFIDLPFLNEEKAKLSLPFPLILGAQNVSPFENGSYTGEVSASQIQTLVSYSLVGHSERRKNFRETNQEVLNKIKNLVKAGIRPILCAQSLEEVPSEVKDFTSEQILIMFEPAKAISTDGVYKAESPETVKKTIDLWKEKLGNYEYLYGGSVNETNCKDLLQSGVTGFVVGHASLSPSSFVGIIKNVE